MRKQKKNKRPVDRTGLPFWKRKTLNEMTVTEWETLCDGCGKCCLSKLEDEVSGRVLYTNVACELLDLDNCRCRDYDNRQELMPSCCILSQRDQHPKNWLPMTCAYRLLAEGRELPVWHHLVCGDADEVHRTGVSVKGKAVSETYIHPSQLEDHIVAWIK